MTINANPNAGAQAGAAPADSTPDADAVFEDVFGYADGEAEAEEEAAEAPAPAPAKPAAKPAPKSAPRGTVEPAGDEDAEDDDTADEDEEAESEDEDEDEEEEVDELDYDHLSKVAAERAGKRESKSGADAKVRELEQTVAELQRSQTESQTAVAVLNKLRGMEKNDPLALLETMGITGDKLVAFLQTGHRQAINRAGFKQAQTVEEMKAQIDAQAAEIEALKTGVPRKIEQSQLEAQWEQNRREFVAITEESEAFPFLAAEAPESRILAAQEAVQVLVAAGHKKPSHEVVAKVAESRLRKQFEKKAALLGKRVVADESSDEGVAQAGGGAAAKRSQTNGSSAKKRAPSTVTQTAAASPPDPRKMSAAELAAEADRVVAEIFLA